MAEAATFRDADYSLAEKAIVSHGGLSPATLPDALARGALGADAAEAPAAALLKVVIRNWGSQVSLEIEPSGRLPASFVRGVEGIVELLTLPPGWNSYSAKPIALHTAITAIRLLAEMQGPATPPPIVVPTVRGGIQLEWHTNGIDIEVYIDSPEDITFFAEEVGSGETCEEPLTGHEDTLRLWVQRVSGK